MWPAPTVQGGTGLSGVSSLFDTVAQAGEAEWYDAIVANLEDTTIWVVAFAAIAAGWLWVWVIVPRYEERRRIRESCSHTLVLDACPPPNVMFSTLRCSKGCGHQEPALDHIRRYEESREDIRVALRVKACPKCGSTCR